MVRCYSTHVHNKQISHLYLQCTRGIPEALVTQSDLTFCQILLLSIDCSPKEVSRRVRTIGPAAEFRGQVLRTACEEMLLSERLCVPTKCDPRREL
ncbi:hypothetical protein ACTXT7_012841 [Hymenolepis weldensis]